MKKITGKVNIRLFLFACFLGVSFIGNAQWGHVRSNNWFEITKTPVTSGGFSVNEIGGKLYLIGGEVYHPDMGISDVRIYDIEADEWSTGTPMPTARYLAPKLNIGTKIYAIGGNKYEYFSGNRVEVYDVSTDSWTRVADLPTSRIYPSACVYKERIYVFGGSSHADYASGENYEGLDMVERYDPQTDTWDTCAPMPTGRYGATACVLNDSIYVIGGTKENIGNHPGLTTVEVYDPVSDSWISKSSMNRPRTELTNVVLDGRIYAFCGTPTLAAKYVNPHFEVYDPISDTWTLHDDPEDLNPQKWAAIHAINVDGTIYSLANMGPYTDTHPLSPEVYVYNTPLVRVTSNPIISAGDSLFAEVLEACKIYIVPAGTPANLDSIIIDSIFSFDVQGIEEQKIPIEDLTPGAYLSYAVASDGRVDLNYYQFQVTEYVPVVTLQVMDDYSMEILSDCKVYMNGKLFVKNSEEEVKLTGWAYDTCEIRVTKSNYFDCDTTLVVKADVNLVAPLTFTISPPELSLISNPLLEKSGYLEMSMNQIGDIYLCPEGTPANADSIINSALDSYVARIDIQLKESIQHIPVGTYRIYGISRLGRVAKDSYLVTIIDSFPVCILEVKDGETNEIIPGFTVIVNKQDTITETEGAYDLTTLVYDSCYIWINHPDYGTLDTTLVVSDSIVIYLEGHVNVLEEKEAALSEIWIYPNPTANLINIQTKIIGSYEIMLTSASGQIFHHEICYEPVQQLELSSYPEGVFFLTIRSNDFVTTRKVIRQ